MIYSDLELFCSIFVNSHSDSFIFQGTLERILEINKITAARHLKEQIPSTKENACHLCKQLSFISPGKKIYK